MSSEQLGKGSLLITITSWMGRPSVVVEVVLGRRCPWLSSVVDVLGRPGWSWVVLIGGRRRGHRRPPSSAVVVEVIRIFF